MEKHKILGIWMDHSSAELIDLNKKETTSHIKSDFNFEVQEEILQRSESHMHNKRQQLHEAYYKAIGEKILSYEHVLLFGPTNAKSELHNYLKKDLHFKDIQMDVESADNITENEKIAFVKKHFNV